MPRPATNAQSALCEHVQRTEDGPKHDGAANITAELASIRRRLETATPGTINVLRARQRIALHQILASRRSSEVTQ